MFRRMLLCAVIALALTGREAAQASVAPPAGTPTATRSAGVAMVGALFTGGLLQPHTCTAVVLDSPHGDLVMTAAHCVVGDGTTVLFVPGYLNGRAPYGVWRVLHAWAAPAWLARQDPRSDVAVLQVGPAPAEATGTSLQSRTGGAPVGQSALTPPAPVVTTVAYPVGRNDAPVSCAAPLGTTQGYPTFTCHGYPAGTSGAPFLWRNHGHPPQVIGVIGGLHQGGCYEWNSFSSPFTLSVYRLMARAINAQPGDVLPVAGSDGC